MGKTKDNYFVICEDSDGNLIVKKVSEVIFDGVAYTNALRIGRYHIDIVKDEDGITYTNMFTSVMYLEDEDGIYLEKNEIDECDYDHAIILQEKELIAFLKAKLKENNELIERYEKENEIMRNVISEYNL